MEFKRSVCRMLHDEHQATVLAMDGLEELLAQGRRGVPDLDRPAAREQLATLAGLIEHEVRRHFDFEETQLFTRLAEAGDAAIGEHLTEEHRAILPVGERVVALARTALGNGLSETEWDEFRGLAAELIERLLAHIQKEEMALLPLLEQTLEADEDLTLMTKHSSQG